jgi:hypothetical protein
LIKIRRLKFKIGYLIGAIKSLSGGFLVAMQQNSRWPAVQPAAGNKRYH